MQPKQIFFLSFSTALLASLLVGLFTLYYARNSVLSVPSFSFVTDSGTAKVQQLQSAVQVVAKAVSPSVVSVVISEEVQTYRTDPFGFFMEPSGTVKRKVGGGSGIFISKNGLVLTNKHVVADANADYAILTADDQTLSGKVVALDPITDLAVIQTYGANGKIPDDTPAAVFAGADESVSVGEFVVAIGNALAQFQNTVTFGVISGLERTINVSDSPYSDDSVLAGLIQTDAAINPGNSGGPLLNLAGHVIGIDTAIAQNASGLGFTIPLYQNEVDYIIASVQKYGKIRRSYLGVAFSPLSPAAAKSLGVPYGDRIVPSGVMAGSPAEKAGLQSGDVIVSANGMPLSGNLTLADVLKTVFPGQTATLQIYSPKSKTTRSVGVVLDEAR